MKLFHLSRDKYVDRFYFGKIITPNQPYQVEFVPYNTARTKLLPVCDFPWVISDSYTDLRFGEEHLVCSERAFRVIEPFIRINETIVHILHYETSKFFLLELPLLDEGGWKPKEEYMINFQCEHHIFKLFNKHYATYFSEEAYNTILEANLIGADFYQVWPED